MWTFIGEAAIGVTTAALLFWICEILRERKMLLAENARLIKKESTLEDELEKSEAEIEAWKGAAAEFGFMDGGKKPRRPKIPISQQWENLGRYSGRPQIEEES